MFNSQKINNDPSPYVSSSGSRHANPGWMGSEYFSNRRERPEYDNNPNPILVQMRKRGYAPAEVLNDLDYLDIAFSAEHIDHARKVLTRLVNIFGTEEP